MILGRFEWWDMGYTALEVAVYSDAVYLD